MNRVVHFELGCVEPERAAKFYSEVFGWKIDKWGGPTEYYMAVTGPDSQPGINGGLLKHMDAQPRTVNTIQVDSIEEAVAKVAANGGKEVVPKMEIPGVGWLAYCNDTEGNIFGVFVPHPPAK